MSEMKKGISKADKHTPSERIMNGFQCNAVCPESVKTPGVGRTEMSSRG